MEERPRFSAAWALGVLVVVVVAMVIMAGLYVFQSLRSLPGEAVGGGLELAGEVREIARAFRQGTVETSFVNYASRLRGRSLLQVASLEQTEVYTRREEGSVLWGQIALPDVVVAATVPIEYTYVLDLEDEWRFRLEQGVLWVEAPRLRFNTPSLDVSRLHFEVRESSVLRDEDAVVEALRAGLTELARERAGEHVDLVRETARRQTREFVRTWMAAAFSDAGHYTVEVVFVDEGELEEGVQARD